MPKKCEKERKFQSLAMKNEGGKTISKHTSKKTMSALFIIHVYRYVK